MKINILSEMKERSEQFITIEDAVDYCNKIVEHLENEKVESGTDGTTLVSNKLYSQLVGNNEMVMNMENVYNQHQEDNKISKEHAESILAVLIGKKVLIKKGPKQLITNVSFDTSKLQDRIEEMKNIMSNIKPLNLTFNISDSCNVSEEIEKCIKEALRYSTGTETPDSTLNDNPYLNKDHQELQKKWFHDYQGTIANDSFSDEIYGKLESVEVDQIWRTPLFNHYMTILEIDKYDDSDRNIRFRDETGVYWESKKWIQKRFELVTMDNIRKGEWYYFHDGEGKKVNQYNGEANFLDMLKEDGCKFGPCLPPMKTKTNEPLGIDLSDCESSEYPNGYYVKCRYNEFMIPTRIISFECNDCPFINICEHSDNSLKHEIFNINKMPEKWQFANNPVNTGHNKIYPLHKVDFKQPVYIDGKRVYNQEQYDAYGEDMYGRGRKAHAVHDIDNMSIIAIQNYVSDHKRASLFNKSEVDLIESKAKERGYKEGYIIGNENGEINGYTKAVCALKTLMDAQQL